jgi:carboxypeptidase family protein
MSLRPLACALVLVCSCKSSSQPAVDGGGDDDASPDSSSLTTVTFSYTPGWDGILSVDVLGAFGRSDDWTAPLVTLTASGGTFTGTAQLPDGTYPYLFHVVGDAAAGAKADTLERFAIDPASAAYVACPPESPTYNTKNANPCGRLAVPVAAPSLFHLSGTVRLDGAAAAGYLVLVERQEPDSHHFFANRVTTGAAGTYDVAVAPGNYRIQVQHPTFESAVDEAIDPKTHPTLRRQISSAVAISTADVAMSVAEMAFHDYAAMKPTPTATLPTTFAFGTELPAHLDVYGTANAGKGKEVGDPWFASAAVKTGTASFDGTFTTKQALETAAALGERYFWGVEQVHPADANGVVWLGQSLVFPITWN